MRGGVAIDLLGGFRARVDGAAIAAEAWPNRRALQIVQLLCLAERRALPRDEVVDALWPSLDAEAGGANLRKAAHHARQALGRADAVVLRGGVVALLPDVPVELDVEGFERLAAAALASGDAGACAGAAAAYGGELLPESRFDPWTEAPRTRLHDRRLALLRAAGDWAGLARAEPTDEPAHRALMREALDGGSPSVAIRWYERLRTALERGLGVRPDAETEALYARCVDGLGAGAARVALRGRTVELATLAALRRAPAASRVGGAWLRGPAGIGKSALCAELTRAAADDGWAVVSVVATHASRPYGVVGAAIEQALLDGDRSAILDAIGSPACDVLERIGPLPPAPTPSTLPLARHQVVGALHRVLIAAARGRTPMLVVDDAHLVDEASADVLLQLAGTGRPVMLVLASRPQGAPPVLERGLARLVGAARVARIELGPLPADAAAAVIADAGPASLDAVRVTGIVEAAEGLPFALVELARAARGDRGAAGARPAGTVDEAIAARLCDVDDDALASLRRLALAGDAFDTATVLALDGGDEAGTFSRLDRALRAGVLVVAGNRYRFRHELVRQALGAQLAPHHRLAAHRDAARRLAAVHAPPGTVAHHWLEGGRVDEALPCLLEAARDAMRVGAWLDAITLLDTLLRHAPSHAEGLAARAESLDAIGDARALAAYDAAAAAVGEPANHDLRAKRALATIKQGDPAGALRVLEGLAPTSVEGRVAQALAWSGAAALGFADPSVGTAKAAEVRRLALETGDEASLVIASWAQAAAAHARGELDRNAWADLRDTRSLPRLATRVFDGQLCFAQRFLYGARPYPDVIAFFDAFALEAKRVGAARGEAFAVTLRGEARLLAGALDEADADLEAGARLHRAIGGATGEAFSLQRRAEVAMHRGRDDAAHALLDEALDVARQSDVGFHLLDRIYGTRMQLAPDGAAALAALEEAEDAVRGPQETCPGCRINFAVPAAIAAARAGRVDLARHWAGTCEWLAKVVMKLPAWDAGLDEVRGHVALAEGDAAAARDRFAAAAEAFRRAGHPLDATRCDRLSGGDPTA
jgi:DNA-binding SARP family transcriptional activator/tetratricopeptide (TPR) repeat protein